MYLNPPSYNSSMAFFLNLEGQKTGRFGHPERFVNKMACERLNFDISYVRGSRAVFHSWSVKSFRRLSVSRHIAIATGGTDVMRNLSYSLTQQQKYESWYSRLPLNLMILLNGPAQGMRYHDRVYRLWEVNFGGVVSCRPKNYGLTWRKVVVTRGTMS